MSTLSAQQAEWLAEEFTTLAGHALAQPDVAVCTLPLMGRDERAQLEEWNGTECGGSGAECVQELFERQVQKRGEAVAVVSGDGQMSYIELERRANQMARYLRRQGVGAESRVGICLERGCDLVVALLGVLKAGGCYVPLDPEYPVERQQYMIADAGVKVVVTERRLAVGVERSGARLVLLEEEGKAIGQESAERLEPVTGRENLAYVIYTSGSTGQPKGVGVRQGSLVNHMEWMQREFGYGEQERVLQKTASSFDASVWEFYAPLGSGGTLVMGSAGVQREVDALGAALKQERITIVQMVPTLLAALVASGGLKEAEDVRLLCCGGEALKTELVKRALEQREKEMEIVNLYGPTEATIDATYWRGKEAPCGVGVPIGRPVTNTQVYVVEESGMLAPVGAAGELYIGGAGLARGYLNRPELTAERFVPHPFSQRAGERLYRTGDRVRWTRAGELEFLGRIDEQVKLRGYRIELGEIESVLLRHEAVKQSVVVVRKKGEQERLVAYVVAATAGAEAGAGEGAGTGTGLDEEKLKQYLRQYLPEYMIPARIVALERLPLTANGKIDRHNLPEPEERSTSGAAEAPRTAVEEILAGIWAEVLNRDVIGIHDNFFELGGHSLLAAQLMARVRQVFGLELSLRVIFERPTIAGVGETVEAAQCAGAELRIPQMEKRGEKQVRMSFAQERLCWFLQHLEPESPTYNCAVVLRLRGEVKEEALAAALGEIVRRHEVLRTRFVLEEGVPMQRIENVALHELRKIDLRGQGAEQREREQERLAAESRLEPFRLEQSAVRTTLVRLGNEEYVLLVTLHHIVTDAWSDALLVREFVELYENYCKKQAPRLAELPLQYGDYAAWQREWLQGEEMERELEYWRKKLEQAPRLELGQEREQEKQEGIARTGAIQAFEIRAGVDESASAVEPARKGNAVYGAAGRAEVGAGAVGRADRRGGGNIDREPEAGGGEADRLLRQRTGAADIVKRRPEFRRVAEACARNGAAGAGASGCPVREGGGGSIARAKSDPVAPVHGGVQHVGGWTTGSWRNARHGGP